MKHFTRGSPKIRPQWLINHNKNTNGIATYKDLGGTSNECICFKDLPYNGKTYVSSGPINKCVKYSNLKSSVAYLTFSEIGTTSFSNSNEQGNVTVRITRIAGPDVQSGKTIEVADGTKLDYVKRTTRRLTSIRGPHGNWIVPDNPTTESTDELKETAVGGKHYNI